MKTLARTLMLLASSVVPAVSTAAQEPGGEGEFVRPGYSLLRQDEDWSDLEGLDPAATGDRFDPIKYVPLSADGSVWASFGGRARLRAEGWSDFGFGAPPGADHDDVFALGRLELHGDLHLGEDLRLFAEFKSALAGGRSLPGGTRPIDEDEAALQQLFADVCFDLGSDGDLVLRPGRQMLAFGKQRLVSPLPWANSLRTWDGVSAVLRRGGWKATAFATHFVPVDPDSFNDSDHGHDFLGLYATGRLEGLAATLDLYWLSRGRDAVSWNGTSGDEERDTFGARVAGSARGGRLDWELEGAVQTGEVGAEDVSGAWMLAAQAGWRLPDAPGAPRLWAGFDFASGDDREGGDVGTFDQLYPLGHAYLGQADVVGRQNIVDASAGATWKLADDLTLDAASHVLWLADTDDALYNAGGAPSRPGGSFQSRSVGVELDLKAGWRIDRHWRAEVGYSHVFAGAAIEESGPDEDLDFAYVSLALAF